MANLKKVRRCGIDPRFNIVPQSPEAHLAQMVFGKQPRWRDWLSSEYPPEGRGDQQRELAVELNRNAELGARPGNPPDVDAADDSPG